MRLYSYLSYSVKIDLYKQKFYNIYIGLLMEDYPDLHPDVLSHLQNISDEMDATLLPKESVDPAALDEVMNVLHGIPEAPPTSEAQVFQEVERHIDRLRTPLARELIAIWDEPEPSAWHSLLGKIRTFGGVLRIVRYLGKLPDIDLGQKKP